MLFYALFRWILPIDLNSSRVAFENFKELVTRFPQSGFAPDARQHMIFIRNQLAENEMHAGRYYLNRGTYISALNRARWVVENYPETPQAPEALAITVLLSKTRHDWSSRH